MRIHAIQAFEGDALLIESGDANPRYMLIDAGPKNTYELHVQHYLKQQVGAGGALEAVAISHVDGDHILGVLDLVADVERARADGQPDPFEIKDVWHNSFANTIDVDGTITQRFQALLAYAGAANTAMAEAAATFLGIPEGARLRRNAIKLGVPLNGAFGKDLISPDELVGPTFALGDVTLRIVGPTDDNLRNLRLAWETWLAAHENDVLSGDIQAMANADTSVPNLSSIVMLATSPAGVVLLTGDARGDHILQGLDAAGLMDAAGKCQVDVLKVQHHGSDRNIDPEFVRRVPAKLYLFSADGKNGNPDYKTLQWIIEGAQADGRQITLVVTNKTPSTTKIQQTHPPAAHGYTLKIKPTADHAIVVDLATV